MQCQSRVLSSPQSCSWRRGGYYTNDDGVANVPYTTDQDCIDAGGSCVIVETQYCGEAAECAMPDDLDGCFQCATPQAGYPA